GVSSLSRPSLYLGTRRYSTTISPVPSSTIPESSRRSLMPSRATTRTNTGPRVAPRDTKPVAGGGRSARKRRAIMQAATALFLRDGYRSTSMDQIAADAAVSKQTVYKQFADKEQLFREIVLEVTGN